MKKVFGLSKTVCFVVAASLFLVVSACSKKMMFASSSVVPAATGSVKIKTDNNKNHTIDVSVTNLASADKLSPPKNIYVVWMVTENNGTKNIGQLNSSSGLLSKTMKASLKTVTSFNPTSFFITAEDNGDIQYPQSSTVLTTN
jgi:hypothetical protein